MSQARATVTGLASIGISLVAVAAVSLGAQSCAEPPKSNETFASSAAKLQVDEFDGSDLPDKTLALTFDDGPGDYAIRIADYLQSEGIQAAFFSNGNRITTSTDLDNENNIAVTDNVPTILSTILADGHLIGNHTVTHRDIENEILPMADGASQLFKELEETDTDLSGSIPSGIYLFRPPYGSYGQDAYDALKTTTMNKYVGPVDWAMGGNSGDWPNSAADWACWQGDLTNASDGQPANGTGYATTQQCGDAYLNEIGTIGHGIVLMHDPYFWDQGNTLDMVKYIVPKLKAAGYSFVRVDQVPAIQAALPGCDASCATCSGTSSTDCTTCPRGAYLDKGACMTCSTCDTGMYKSSSCSGTSDTVCSTCTSCGAGKYAAKACTTKADTVCTICGPGTYSAAGATACTPCAVGSASAASGATSCAACPAGTDTSAMGQTMCNACAAGTFADAGAGVDAGATSCSDCAAGTFSAIDSAACASCPAGTFAAASAASCTACAPGSYAAVGASTCTSCGSCDDGDACTSDVCNAMSGCTHDAILGCVVVVDAGAPDAGETAKDASAGDAASGGSGSSEDGGASASDAATGAGGPTTGGSSGDDDGSSDAAVASTGGSGSTGATTGDASVNGATSGATSGGCSQSGESGSPSPSPLPSPALLAIGVALLVTRQRRRAA